MRQRPRAANKLLAAALLATLVWLGGCRADAPTPGTESGGVPAGEPIAAAELTFERLVNAGQEPENWLMYSGDYGGQRHSLLDQINRDTVE